MPSAAASSPLKLTYAATGVDIDAGDKAVDLIGPMLRRTHGPRVIGKHGAFAGMFRLDYNEKLFKRNYKEPVLIACTDGVGTKVKLAADMKTYDTVGIDCVAMNVNDLIVQGGEPLMFLDYLGIHKNVPRDVAAMVEGVARGCEIAGCALLGGEMSEMPDVYAPGDFDVVGFAVGVVELHRVIDPARVEVGDIVIGLASSGVHSNGYSLVRKIIEKKKLRLDKTYDELKASPLGGEGGAHKFPNGCRSAPTLGETLLEPTRIYAKPIVKLLRKYTVKHVVCGMAHITGGGLLGNVCRALSDDTDARIDTSAWEPPPIFEFLQRYGNIDREEMYRVFNMGIGYALIVRPSFAKSIVQQLKRWGEKAWIIGEVVKGRGEVVLA